MKNAAFTRRQELLKTMEEGDVLLLFSEPEAHDLGGACRFYQDRDFYYLSAFPEPEAALLLVAGDKSPFSLFVRPRDEDEERWTGRRYGVEGAVDIFGADRAWPIGELESKLAEILCGKRRLFYRFGVRPEQDALVLRVLTHLRRNQRPENIPSIISDSGRLVHPLRLVKSDEEITLMERAVEITVEAYERIMKETHPGMMEYQVEAMLYETYRSHGCDGPSFPAIVAAGVNATYLHYAENTKRIEKGELLLVDSGCLYGGYASDLTRTFMPDREAMTAEQEAVYRAVLTVQEKMIAMVKPGTSLYALNQACQREMAQVCLDLGLLSGTLDEVMEKNAHKTFFPHRLGHWVGSDVHDAGSYGMEDPDLPLAPGMVLTIEPGLYVPEESEGAAARFAGIGVRIEDDLLVTPEGSRTLSVSLVK